MTVMVGTAGWVYPPWRGTFYPKGLAHRKELEYLSGSLSSVELNGTFYALQRPESFQRWATETPDGFVFSVKGARFITHMKRLLDPDQTLPNFFASGVLALGAKLGPFLWQLPPNMTFDAGRVDDFCAALPRTTGEAAAMAVRHDERLDGRAFTGPVEERPLRHAVEVRHASFVTPEFLSLLRKHNVAVVVADTAGKWPLFDELTANFGYLRLHGDVELYTSGYTESALRKWAAKIGEWARTGDVYVYFDNDVKARAPFDAMALSRHFR
jgi:uncharacterized protein YecE (DUF72 family)